MNKKSKEGQLQDDASIHKAIDKMETQALGYKNDLASWQSDPIREEAMQARHEELAQDMQDLVTDRDIWQRTPDLTFDMGKTTKEAIMKADAETQGARTEYWNAVVGLRDQLHEFLAEKAKNAEELAAILLERASRESIDVDMSEFDAANDIELEAEPEKVEEVKMEKVIDASTPRVTVPKKFQAPTFSRASETTKASKPIKLTSPRFTKPGSIDKAA